MKRTGRQVVAAYAALVIAGALAPPRASAQAEAPVSPPARLRVEATLDNVLQFEDLHQKPSDFLMNTTRLTGRASGVLSPRFEYKLGVVGRFHSGTKRIDYVPFVSPNIRATLVPADPVTASSGAGPYLESSIAGDVYLQEAYGTIRGSQLYVRAGRQKVQSGTGYSYNPTDLFNRRVPLDPTYEPDGFDAVAVGWTFSRGAELQVLAARRAGPAWRARLQGAWQGADFALQFASIRRGRVDWQAINTPASVAALDAGVSTVDDFSRDFRWNQLSGEISRVLGGTRVYAEAGFVFIQQPAEPGTLGPDSHDHERILVGVDRRFDSGVRLVAEYMRLGEGRAAGDPQTLNDQIAFNKGETLSTDKNNVFVEVSAPFARAFSGALKVIGCLDHAALGLNPWLHFDPLPRFRLSASIYHYAATDGSPYSNVGLGAFAQLKYAF
mgnify:CR=1 FL=1